MHIKINAAFFLEGVRKKTTGVVHRVEVSVKSDFSDPVGESVRKDIAEDLGLQVDSVRTVDVYSTNIKLTQRELEEAARGPFSDPIVQVYSIDEPLTAKDYDWLIEVGFRPGVTDNVGMTAKDAIENLLGRKVEGAVFTSRKYLIKGNIRKAQVSRIAKDLLANSLIERWEIVKKGGEYEWMDLPIVKGDAKPVVSKIDLNISDDELEKISERGVLAMTLEEMKIFREYFRNPQVIEQRKKVGLSEKPTDAELESFAQTQSEHCKHKIFNAVVKYREDGKEEQINSIMKTYIMGATNEIRKRLGRKDFCVSVFKDNAGVVKFDDDYNLVFKVETHNSPSALDPYGGAITGIVGVNRDPMGTGKSCRLIFNTDVFCFGSPYTPPEKVPKGVLHPKRIFKGVRLGVEHGGNRIGIPTVNGTVYFGDCFIVRPLVYCGTGGIMPSVVNGQPSHIKKAQPGDNVVMVGGRIGKDGIHGATFSSVKLHEKSPASAVQIGAPIVQKRMQDMILEARELDLYTSITDNGAGGLNSSVGEMARECGGCEFDIKDAPLKYHGLQPWEILLSEAQERMTLAVPPAKLEQFLELCERRGVEATVLGEFTNSGKYHVKYGGKTIVYLDMKFLHEGLLQMRLEAEWSQKKYKEPELSEKGDYTLALKQLLSHLNICSKEWVVRQYDHEVQDMSVIKPLMGKYNDGPSDSAVLKPLRGSWRGVAISNGINPQYGMIDAYHMTACCMDEAVRNIISSGGSLEQIALLDNFCWPSPKYHPKDNPDGKFKMGQLVRANKAVYDYAVAYGTPFISGKDSMSSDKVVEGAKYSIKPTILVSGMGIVKDVRKAVSIDAKEEGDLVYVLGETKNELGGSVYYQINGYVGNNVPKVNAEKAKKLYNSLSKAMDENLIASCHDCSDGGLAVTLAETAFSGGLGMEVDLRKVPANGVERDDTLLFSESQSRFVVTVNPANRGRFEKIMKGSEFAGIGRVTKSPRFRITGLKGNLVVNSDINSMKEVWQETLGW